MLLDYHSRKVLTFSKTLTTHDNLTRGIRKALNGLQIEAADSVKLVGVSSTLATNSIAVGKERPAGLLLIGYDRDLIAAYDLAARFPTTHWANFRGGHTTQGIEKEPLDLAGIREWVRLNGDKVEALAISGYASIRNPEQELYVKKRFQDALDIPIICAHELSSLLGFDDRTATVVLNAGLIPIISQLIKAVRSVLRERTIDAPVMLVKGDGSLVKDSWALRRHIETVLSGPAASVQKRLASNAL